MAQKSIKNNHIYNAKQDSSYLKENGVSVIASSNKATYNEDGVFLSGGDTYTGGAGSDTFVIGAATKGAHWTIDGSTSSMDANSTNSYGNYTGTKSSGVTDSILTIATRPNATGFINTNDTKLNIGGISDMLEFTKSGDFSDLMDFTHIETIQLDKGVNIIMTADQFLNALGSLDNGTTNPGLHVNGTTGKETLTIVGEAGNSAFIPSLALSNASIQRYSIMNVQLDDSSTANVVKNATIVWDLKTNSVDNTYGRADGTNDSDKVIGANGSNNITLRIGNDTFIGGNGSDVVAGHGGTDNVSGGGGDDYFTIGGFGSGITGTTSKADDGNAEWLVSQIMADVAAQAVNDDVKHDYSHSVNSSKTNSTFMNATDFDIVDGGTGWDVLRITTGIGANTKDNGTVVLNDQNFKNMEEVDVGATLKAATTEDSTLQIINNHYYFDAIGKVADTAGNNGGTIDNVVINAVAVTKKGLTFVGNANSQTFIGTQKDDIFFGNGGHDTLTGGSGADRFVFGKVISKATTTATSDTTIPTGYITKSIGFNGAIDSDVITDFTSGTDKIQLNVDQFTKLGSYYQDDDGLWRINSIGLANATIFLSEAGAVATTPTQYLIYDNTSGTLYYDADGNGNGAAMPIVVLGSTQHPALTYNDLIIS